MDFVPSRFTTKPALAGHPSLLHYSLQKSSKKYISGCLGRAWEQINCNGGTGDLPGMMELF